MRRQRGPEEGKRGPRRLWPNAMILASIRYLAKELKRTPSAREINASEHCPSEMLVRLRFGSINTAIHAAGLPPHVPGGRKREHRATVEKSNHRWMLATIDPAKARAITESKMAHWGFRSPARNEVTRPQALPSHPSTRRTA